MDVLITPDGKYDVRFNGTLYNSCQNDLDCLGELVCVKNESWSAYPELCVCPPTLGRTGAECKDTNTSGYVLVAISCVSVLLSAGSFFLGAHNLWKVFWYPAIRTRVPRNSALFTTLSLSVLATLSIVLQSSYQVASHFVPRTAVVRVTSEPTKQSDLIYLNLSTTTCAFFFSIVAALNVSLVLIEIADRVTQGSTKVHINVFVYRKFLIAYVFTFAALIIAFAAVGRAEWTFAAAAPAMFFIAVTFFIGWYRLSRLFRVDVTSTGSSVAKLQKTMRNIRVTTLAISVCAAGMIVCGILQVSLNDLNRPDGSWAAIPGRVIWVFASLAMLVLVRYTHVLVNAGTNSSNNNERQQEVPKQAGLGRGGAVVAAAEEVSSPTPSS